MENTKKDALIERIAKRTAVAMETVNLIIPANMMPTLDELKEARSDDWRVHVSTPWMTNIEERDKMLEQMWGYLDDVPFDPESETIEEDFLCFKAGTSRDDIWHWFDARHSKGVVVLLYGIDANA
jgi:hypothetical protein